MLDKLREYLYAITAGILVAAVAAIVYKFVSPFAALVVLLCFIVWLFDKR